MSGSYDAGSVLTDPPRGRRGRLRRLEPPPHARPGRPRLSAALNRGDEEAAAALFGPKAVFVAGDYQTVLRTRAQVLAFHRAMGWCGQIVRLVANGNEV